MAMVQASAPERRPAAAAADGLRSRELVLDEDMTPEQHSAGVSDRCHLEVLRALPSFPYIIFKPLKVMFWP